MTNEFKTVAEDAVSTVVHETVGTPTYTTAGYTTGTSYATTPTYTTSSYATTTPTYTTSYTTTPATTTYTTPTYHTVPLTEYPAGYDHTSYQPVETHYTQHPTYTSYDPYGSEHHYHHTDGLALGALIASIAGLTVLPVFGSIVGIILGILALHRLRLSGHNGHGMALAGIILGVLGLLIGVLFGAWLLHALGGLGTTGLTTPYGYTTPYVVR